MNRIVIIGGGASGCAAAISASENPDNQVVVLERQSRIGRKLLSTGNGRCNLSNIKATPAEYMSFENNNTENFTGPALSRFGVDETLNLFHRMGLLTVTESTGRVYPLSDQANSVVDILRFSMEKQNIKLYTARPAQAIIRKNNKFTVRTQEGNLLCDKIIIACGGAAGAKIGGVTDGYTLLESLGHRRTKLRPSLTQIKTDPTYPRALKGVKADASVKLISGNETIAETGGEVLFTEYGVSGPAIFDISRDVSCGTDGLSLSLDFLREYSFENTCSLLRSKKTTFKDLSSENLFTGMVHNRLGKMLCKYAGISANETIGSLTENNIYSAANAVKNFDLSVDDVMGFDSAQVTVGGISLEEFNPATLQSRLVPGIYACGEVLDVDGKCGGYNLQWAWSSGRLAGKTET